MKYPFHTESKPVTGEEARNSSEAIDEAGQSVTNERVALAKRSADRRHQSQVNAQSKQI